MRSMRGGTGVYTVDSYNRYSVAAAQLWEHTSSERVMRRILGLYAGIHAFPHNNTHPLLYIILMLLLVATLLGWMHADFGGCVLAYDYYLLRKQRVHASH
jgi:hypothetical protein